MPSSHHLPAPLSALAIVCLAIAARPEAATAQPVNLLPPAAPPPPSATASPTSRPLAPIPAVDSAPLTYLQAARSSVQAGRYAAAQEALERAETRLLGQSPPAPPEVERAVLDIGVARQGLACRDRPMVEFAINDAVAAVTRASYQPSAPPPPSPPGAPVVPPAPPPVLWALLPGHWELRGWRYVWVPPETVPRRVEERLLVPGYFVWRDGRWEWVPTHYATN